MTLISADHDLIYRRCTRMIADPKKCTGKVPVHPDVSLNAGLRKSSRAKSQAPKSQEPKAQG